MEDMHRLADAKRDFTHKEEARGDASASEGLKLLLALNGGGCLAILGFFQGLMTWEKARIMAAFATPGVAAMAFFAGSLALSATIPLLRTHHIRSNMHRALSERVVGDTRWTPIAITFWWIALLSFTIGLGCVGYGIHAAAGESVRLAPAQSSTATPEQR